MLIEFVGSAVKLDGELTHTTCTGFLEQINKIILTDQSPTLTLDCTNLRSLDGSGLGAITTIFVQLRTSKRILLLENIQGQPQQLITNLNLNRLFKGKRHVKSR